MKTDSSTLVWRIPRTEEPGRLQSTGSQSDMTERLTRLLSLWGRQCAVSIHGWGVRAGHHGGHLGAQGSSPRLVPDCRHDSEASRSLRPGQDSGGRRRWRVPCSDSPRALCGRSLVGLCEVGCREEHLCSVFGAPSSPRLQWSVWLCYVPFKVLWGEGDWGKPGEGAGTPAHTLHSTGIASRDIFWV